MRRAAKVDSNQKAIVKALRTCGASVQHLHAVGAGCPDLLVGFMDRATGQRINLLVEVKDGSKPPSARRLTGDQVTWHAHWNGSPPVVVKSIAEALEAIGIPFEGVIS